MIHPSSDVQSSQIGSNTNIWQFCVVLSGAVIGGDCNINANVFIENDVVVGNRVTVKSGVQLWDGIRIEDDVFIGPNVTFTNDSFWKSNQAPGWVSLVVIISFFSGLILLSLAMIAEYIWRIFEEVKGRPGYIIKK